MLKKYFFQAAFLDKIFLDGVFISICLGNSASGMFLCSEIISIPFTNSALVTSILSASLNCLEKDLSAIPLWIKDEPSTELFNDALIDKTPFLTSAMISFSEKPASASEIL